MLYTACTWGEKRELVFIPFGADKGDCPFCYPGVLRREGAVENRFNVKEGYVCDHCGTMFVELHGRYFKRIAVDKKFTLKRS